MKVVCAPDSFKGSLTATEAAAAMATGLRDAMPDVIVDSCPVGDGGEGTLAALLAALDGEVVDCQVQGVSGGPVDAGFGRFAAQGFSFVESASAIALRPEPEQRDVMAASSFGVGQLLEAACRRGAGRVLVGLGGTATNDGGCGMAQALGVRFYDASGAVIEAPLSGGTLATIDRIETGSLPTWLSETEIVALCDVNNPLTGPAGAAAVYAPQKGASPSDVDLLDAGLVRLAGIIDRDLDIDVDQVPGAGAAGGLGAGLLAFTGASIVSGIDTILDVLDFDGRVAGARLCLTGEGRIDGQSMSGKACMGVAAVAARHKVPTVALVGDTGPRAAECIDAGLAGIVVIGEGLSAEQSIGDAAALLSAAAIRTAKQYLGNSDSNAD